MKAQSDQLDIQYILDNSFSNKTDGLLGNFNGVKVDDLIPMGSSMPLNASTATPEEIYEFGNTCKVYIHILYVTEISK